jgi:uncharacterized repeat protein (TIGR03803 family)
MNTGRSFPSATLLTNGLVLVLGGDPGQTSAELYNPAWAIWSITGSLNSGRVFHTATLLTNGNVLVTGGDAGILGYYNGPALAVVEMYGSVLTTPGLIVTASPLTGSAPLTVQFTSPGVDSAGNTVTNWNWDFGDGRASTAQSPAHIYTNLGSFSPSLAAYSTYGASPLAVTGPGTVTLTNHTLDVAASPQAGALPLTVQFTSPGVDSGGNAVTNWNWSFGDGGSSVAQNPSYVYAGVGSFSPSLVARSTYGAWPLAITGPGGISVTNTPNPAFRTLYSFTPAFGSEPNAGLVLSGNTLFGTTRVGGSGTDGTVFAVNTDGTGFTNLHHFSGSDGLWPYAGLILSGSTLYGTTVYGGNRGGGGTVFAINTNGTGFTNVLNFNGVVDPSSGDYPYAGVVLSGNILYGTTWYGGAYNNGTVFSVATNGANSGILHSFYYPDRNFANPDGIFPSSRLLSSGGTLYGTALDGGSSGFGAVFAVNTNAPGSFRILHYFTARDPITAANSDGANPWAGLVLSGSTLYGTTASGGTNGSGTVFAVNTDGSGITNLHSFTGGIGGSGPHAGLTLSGNTLYGTTAGGGTSSHGTLFAINTDGSGFTSLYSFTGGSDGADPESDLILSGNTLYGTAKSGGSSGNGTVFSFTLPSILLANPLKLPGGSFQFSFLHIAGSTNTVFATTNVALAFSNWASLGTATEVSPGHFQFTDTHATNITRRFYRVRSP